MSASTSPLPYTGNKSCIVNTILSVMPKHTVYIDPCMGSAEVFFRKPRAEKEILNDYNGDLVNLFRVIQNNEKLAYLLGRLYLSINGELAFKQNKDRLKGVPNILDDVIETSQIFYDASWEDIQNAAAFLENQVYSFSSTGQTFGIARRDMSQRLPRLMSAYSAFRDAKPDPVAREKMANASALAGIAFANAFLGINHSLSHKLGGWFHIPHGTANALLFPFVCRFNAQRHPYKMGTFSQYKYPQAFERYVELGELIGVKGKTDEQTFENWIKACEQLKKDIDIPETILDWLLEAHPEKTAEEWETEFLAAVDQMSEWAFHDACTGCNPVYPTIAELKGCYLKAFYGEKKYAEKYGDIWEVPVTLPTDTHAAYPMGLCADLGVEKTGGFN